MKTMKKLYAIIFILLLIASSLSIYSAESTKNMYSSEAAGDGSNYKNTDEGTVAVCLDVKGGKFTGLVIPSWYSAPSSTIIILYKWDTDYQKTVSKAPVYTDVIEDADSTGWVDPGQNDFTVKFERAFAEGKYLLVFRKNTGNALHIPTHASFSDAAAYLNGNVYENISYRVSVIVDPAAALNEAPNLKIKIDEIKVPVYGNGASGDGLSHISVHNYDSVAHKFTVTGGYFTGFIINDIFLQSGYGEIELSVYKWKDNYEKTVETAPVFIGTFEGESEADGTYKDFTMYFQRAYAEGDYLVKIVCADGLNLWAHAAKDGVTSYLDNEVYEHGTLKLSYIANSATELDERPVETPVPSPTPETTPTPVSTSTPTATVKPEATKKPGSENNGNTFLIIAVIAAIAVAAVIAVLVIRSKKKR